MANETTQPSPLRRRGSALEAALLDAAWTELKAVGYSQLTYDAVAERAGTSRTVLYRRWPQKHDLILAAMRNHAPLISGPIPDTGSLRGDVVALLERAATQLDTVGRDVVWGLLSDVIAKDMLSQKIQVDTTVKDVMTTILKRADARGEVDFAVIPEIVITLPLDLNRHTVLTTGKAPSQSVIKQIVDDIFLPLVLK